MIASLSMPGFFRQLIPRFLSNEELTQTAVAHVTVMKLVSRDRAVQVLVERVEYAVTDRSRVALLLEVRGQLCLGDLSVAVGVNRVENAVGVALAEAKHLQQRRVVQPSEGVPPK